MLSSTPRDQAEGFPRLTAQLDTLPDDTLRRAYTDGMRDCFDRMFGHNACVLQNQIALALLRRGVTTIPNIFGAIDVQATWRR